MLVPRCVGAGERRPHTARWVHDFMVDIGVYSPLPLTSTDQGGVTCGRPLDRAGRGCASHERQSMDMHRESPRPRCLVGRQNNAGHNSNTVSDK